MMELHICKVVIKAVSMLLHNYIWSGILAYLVYYIRRNFINWKIKVLSIKTRRIGELMMNKVEPTNEMLVLSDIMANHFNSQNEI